MDVWRLLVLLAFVADLAGSQPHSDPCDPNNYTAIREAHRSIGYTLSRGEEPYCDVGLFPGWYRFTSPAGGMIPEQCPRRGQCGTAYGIWMQDTHPSATDGIVARNFCTDLGEGGRYGRCCDEKMTTGVKNCGSYFVYYLKATKHCPIAYCAGNQTVCPDGQWAPPGSSVCRDKVPHMTVGPTVTGPETRGHAFRFSCNINFADTDPEVMFEVQWLFNGETDPIMPSLMVANPQREAQIHGSAVKYHMGKELGCRVRAFFKNGPTQRRKRTVQTGPWVNSTNTYFAGVNVNPNPLVVRGNGGSLNVTLSSTVPIVCDARYIGACCIYFLLRTQGPNSMLQVPNHPCNYMLCSSDWDSNTHTASTTITVVATKSGLPTGNRDMLLSFEPLDPVGGGMYLNTFANYSIPPIPVTVEHKGPGICTWQTDPHFYAFNKQTFDVLQTGDYTIYLNERDNFEVQSRMEKCSWSASCQCGVAIREEQDVIRISNCGHSMDSAPTITTNHQPLRPGTDIQRSHDGKHILVIFPSGRSLKLDMSRSLHSTSLTLPASDAGHGKGLCGDLDGPRGQWEHRDGHVDHQECSSHSHQGRVHCHPVNFMKSWRTNSTNNLFDDTIANNPPRSSKPDPLYCQCDVTNRSNPHANCSVPDPKTPQSCTGVCPSVTSSIPAWMTSQWQSGGASNQGPTASWMNSGWSVGRRDVASNSYVDLDQPDPPVNSAPNSPTNWNPTWPTASGIAQSQAEAECNRAHQQSQLYSYCQHYADILDFTVSSCVTDILFSDNFTMVEANVAGFTSLCHFAVTQDLNNYVTDSSGNMVLRQDVPTKVCASECFQNGHCVAGRCVCNTGFTGVSCQLQVGRAPQLIRIRGSAMCDIRQKPCRKIFLDADQFEMSDNFKCRVQQVLASGQTTTVTTEAEFITDKRVACSLPDVHIPADRSLAKLSVSMTYDGSLYSNALDFSVYDSQCVYCGVSGCIPKSGTCLIDDVCYSDGDVKPGDVTQTCKPAVSLTEWYSASTETATGAPVLTKAGITFICTLPATSLDPSMRREVTWLVDDRQLPGLKTLAEPSMTHAYVMTMDLPEGHMVKCQMRTFSVEDITLSDEDTGDFPYIQSNSLPL